MSAHVGLFRASSTLISSMFRLDRAIQAVPSACSEMAADRRRRASIETRYCPNQGSRLRRRISSTIFTVQLTT